MDMVDPAIVNPQGVMEPAVTRTSIPLHAILLDFAVHGTVNVLTVPPLTAVP